MFIFDIPVYELFPIFWILYRGLRPRPIEFH